MAEAFDLGGGGPAGSGWSGWSGYGHSGASGYSGYSGFGASGYSGAGASGFSGFSGPVAPTSGSAVLDFVSTDLTFQDPTKIELNSGKLELKYVGGGAAVVSPTNLTADDARVIKSSERTGFEAWHVFDGSTSTGFDDQIAQVMPHWVGYYFDTAQDIIKYRFLSGIAGVRGPDAWKVEYSDNGSSWTALHTVTGQGMTYAGTWYTSATLTSAGAHRYWRINMTSGALSSPYNIGFYSVEFWAEPDPYSSGSYWYALTTDASHVHVIDDGTIKSCDVTYAQPASTNIRMLLSFDGRSTWSKWNGVSWEASSLGSISSGNTPLEIEAGLAYWNLSTGENSIDFAIALESDDGESTPSVDEIGVVYSIDVGLSGFSGFSGFSGIGSSGISGHSGFSGVSAWSGGSGISGWSGESGISGWSGVSAWSGVSGQEGMSGWSGTYSGWSGWSGESGFSGVVGFSGTSGFSGSFENVGQIMEIINAKGDCTGDQTINLALGNIVTAKLTGSGTWTITNVAPAGKSSTVTFLLQNAGAFTITWAVVPKWPGGAAPSWAASGYDILVLMTVDSGTTWYASSVPNLG